MNSLKQPRKIFIKQIGIYQSPIKLKKPFVTSLGKHDFAENIIIVIKTNNGITGFGECSPFMTINGESMETCFIVGQYIAKVLINKDPLDIQSCSEAMDNLIYGNSSIKSAFDIALYDIASQQAEMPLYKFLGGNNDKTLITDYTVSMGDAKKMTDDAIKIKKAGFRVIKVKLGETKEKDIERIRNIRKAIGKTIPIRIDANQGWNVETAIEILNALSGFNIQFCEEPIPRYNFMDLSLVKKKSPIPIMADESCCDHHDAKRLIKIRACDMFNIKLGKSSGIFKALKIIKLAEKAKINMQVGGFLESRLGFTASAHLALTSKNILHCDFDTPLMFTEDHVADGINYSKNGIIKIPGKNGLGATINESYLKLCNKKILK
jgi:L-alanine-DL-glutamate epimerase-like enolase superfamily enzyme